jgi:heme A synthase
MLKATTSAASREGRPAAWTSRLRSALAVRYLAAASAVATYALVVLGGTVRATDSGLACPDWPRCHGQLIPPLETEILIEFSHRLAAASVGLLIVGTAVVAWLWYRENRFVLAGVTMAVLLVVAQALIGYATVNKELPETIVALHLSMALIILGILTTTAVVAVWQERPRRGARTGSKGRRTSLGVPALVATAAVATFGLIIVGSYVANSGAALAYTDWPLFDGKFVSAGGYLANLHYVHRLMAAAVGLLVVALAVQTWRSEPRSVLMAAVGFAFALYVTQVVVGAGNIWLELATWVRVIHLALASALWVVLVTALAWSYAEREWMTGEKS